MNDTIKITCPKCQHRWEQSLGKLEKLQEIHKGGKKEHNEKNVVKYRAVCPVDGTYIILEVQED